MPGALQKHMAKTIKAKKCYYHEKFGINAFKCVGWCGMNHHLKQKEKKEDEKKPEESTKFMEIDPDIDEVDIDYEKRNLLPDPVESDQEEMSMALVIIPQHKRKSIRAEQREIMPEQESSIVSLGFKRSSSLSLDADSSQSRSLVLFDPENLNERNFATKRSAKKAKILISTDIPDTSA